MVTLRVDRSKVNRELGKQIKAGKQLILECGSIRQREQLRVVFHRKRMWDDYNEQILFQFFSSNSFRGEYQSAEMHRTHFGWTKDIDINPSYDGFSFDNEVRKMKDMIEQCLGVLESVKGQTKVIPQSSGQIPSGVRSLLHPIVIKESGAALARGEYDNAILASLVQLETEVRSRAALSDTDIGSALMRKAFSPNNGVLADPQRVSAEQTGIMELFAGVMGFHRNRQAHKRPVVSDPKEAIEILIIASHLLRVLGV